MVKIRMTRTGAKKRPYYRVMAIDERKRRDGRPLEFLGTYDPKPEVEVINLRVDAIEAWIAKGAQMSDAVRNLMKKQKKQAALVPAAGAA
jgi:small subunit ribosomal protein S16